MDGARGDRRVVPLFGAIYYALGAPLEPDAYEEITGMVWERTVRELPGIAEYIGVVVGSQAQFMIGFGFFVAVVAALPSRRGKRWSWYALCSVPVLLAALGVRIAVAGGAGWTIIAFLLALAFVGLMPPYRSMFRRDLGSPGESPADS